MWSFQTDPEVQAQLDWMLDFVKREVEPLDYRFPGHGAPYDVANVESRAAIRPLQDEVRRRGLWACHLGEHLGGPGYGQLRLALMNEVLGRSYWAPTVFGTAAPDTGNAEILALFGTDEQKDRYLKPLMDGEIVSCFSMTEPQAGADPKEFVCRAWQEGDEWVIEGEKWFSSNARFAAFLIVMAVTNPENPPHGRMSMFVVRPYLDDAEPPKHFWRNSQFVAVAAQWRVLPESHGRILSNRQRHGCGCNCKESDCRDKGGHGGEFEETDEVFSPKDKLKATLGKEVSYLGTPYQRILKYTPVDLLPAGEQQDDAPHGSRPSPTAAGSLPGSPTADGATTNAEDPRMPSAGRHGAMRGPTGEKRELLPRATAASKPAPRRRSRSPRR